MQDTYALNAQSRKEIGRAARRVRSRGLIPAVIYGHGITPRNLTVTGNEFLRVYRAAGESSLVDLSVEGAVPVKVLIQDVQYEPVRDDVVHIDFREVRMDEKLETKIALQFTDESVAVKGLGGILVKNLNEISVRCLPGALVHEIRVSLAPLVNFGDRIAVRNLMIPQGIEVLDDPNTVVVLVEEPRSEEEMAALEGAVEADVTKVEVTTEKKEGAEGEVAAEGATTEKAEKAEKKDAKKETKK